MRSFAARVIEPEILDTLPPAEARDSLGDLVRLNRIFGGHSALRHALADGAVPRSGALTMIDVGAASGDMARVVRAWNPQACVMSTDRIPSHLKTADAPRLAADAFRLPLRDHSVDYAMSSLFLHHFSDTEVIALLVEMKRVSRRGVLAVDLHRHPVPYWFVPATRWLFRWDRVTAYDAPVSVAAAFRVQELAALARAADLQRPRVRSHGLSFRITLASGVSFQPQARSRSSHSTS